MADDNFRKRTLLERMRAAGWPISKNVVEDYSQLPIFRMYQDIRTQRAIRGLSADAAEIRMGLPGHRPEDLQKVEPIPTPDLLVSEEERKKKLLRMGMMAAMGRMG